MKTVLVLAFFIAVAAAASVDNVSSSTGKSFSEALIFGSTNPQYDRRLFIDLRVQYMKIPSSEHGENMGRT